MKKGLKNHHPLLFSHPPIHHAHLIGSRPYPMLDTPSGDTMPHDKPLTDKQQAFVDSYMTNGFNATQAAITAGYSKDTARQQGSRLLTNVDIQNEIKRLMRDFVMPAEEVLSRLTEHARGDLGDLVGDDGSIDWKAARKEGKTGIVKRVKRKTTHTTSKDGSIDTQTVDEELELHSPQNALQLLGKYHTLFVERVEHSGNVSLTWEQMVMKGKGSHDDSDS